MPTNLYFNNFNSKPEQRLYEDLINETVKQWGIDCFYMPRTSGSAVDLLFGDDPTKKFDEAYPVEVYVKNVDSFEGQELYSKFGLEIQNQMRFLLTTRAFKTRVPSTYARPREGDLLWLTNFQALFEIKYVNQQHFFYAFGNHQFYGFELVCERFRYSNEDVETGIIEIDTAIDTQVTTYDFSMVSGGTSTYQSGEEVYQGTDLASSSASGTVVSWNLPLSILTLKNIKGVFTVTDPIIGDSSGANYILHSYNALNNSNTLLDNNTGIGQEADSILDFSEHNPFGEPTQVSGPTADTSFVNEFEQDVIFTNSLGQKVNFPIGNKKPTPKI